MKNITLETSAKNIATAVLDMPGRPFNVFSEDMMADLKSLIDQAAAAAVSGAMKALVITSGKSAFVAGADLAMIEDFGKMRFASTKQEMRQRYSYLGHLFRELEQLPIPVVAAVNGLALGGGLELAMACHARVCVKSPYPLLGLPEILLGLLPGAGGTQRLPRLVGVQEAAKILLGGAPVTPEKALSLGLVQAVVEPEQLLAQAQLLAEELIVNQANKAPWDLPNYTAKPGCVDYLASEDARKHLLAEGGWSVQKANLYPASNAIVNCVVDGFGKNFDAGCDVEWDIFVDLMKQPIASSMVTTGFLNKTAASKIAVASSAIEGHSPQIKSVAWLSAQQAPKRLAKLAVVDVAESQQADITVVDAGSKDLPEQDLALALQSFSASGESNQNSDAELSAYLAAPIAQAEVVELVSAESAATERLASAVSFLCKLGVSPVISFGGASIGQLIVDALASGIKKMDMSAALQTQVARAIDGMALFELAQKSTTDVTAEESLHSEQELRALGIELLLSVSLEVVKQLQVEQQSTPDMESRAGMVDLLAVVGLGFPAWTGGPISLLSMVQYEELDGFDVPEYLAVAISSLPIQLKSAAGYMFTAKSANAA